MDPERSQNLLQLRRLLSFLGSRHRYVLLVDHVQQNVRAALASVREPPSDPTLLPMRRVLQRVWCHQDISQAEGEELIRWLSDVEDAAAALGEPLALVREHIPLVRGQLRLMLALNAAEGQTPGMSSVPTVDLVLLLGAPTHTTCPHCENTEEPTPLGFHCYPVAKLGALPLKDSAVCPACDQDFRVYFVPNRGGTLILDPPLTNAAATST